MDDYGFTDLDDLLNALKRTKHSWAGKEEIERLIERSDKSRFEIKNGLIRALYGHSVDVTVEEEADTAPPKYLYHGTSPRAVDSILEEGIKSRNRQFVHLSSSVKEARRVGKRHHPNPVILEIEAKRAWEKEIDFYRRGDLFLVEYMPPDYIEVLQ